MALRGREVSWKVLAPLTLTHACLTKSVVNSAETSLSLTYK